MTNASSSLAEQGLFWGGTIFLACLLLQILIWRLARPRRQILALFFIYFALPLCACAFLAPATLAAALFLHESLAAAYVLSFPAMQAESPSLGLLLWIWRHGERGCTAEEIKGALASTALLEDRWNDLADDGMVIQDAAGKTQLRWPGWALAKFFLFYRRTLRITRVG